MPFTPADSQIFSPLFNEPEISAIFSDEQAIRRWLEVEGALARVESRLGIIPAEAGEAVSSAANQIQVDMEQLRAGVEQDGFPIIELVRQLRRKAGKAYAGSVHYGATTQDIMDTALILQIRAALDVIENQLRRLIINLTGLADRYRGTLMPGRTHSQQALPISFGFKVAGWLAPLLRHRNRLYELKPRLLVVQFGGAVGTLAALGNRGIEVQAAMAQELGVGILPMPWHTQRDNLAELAGWLSLASGSLGKMAQDIVLLAQSEVGEVRESADLKHGGSSAMPHKSNPITSELILAAARTNAGHLAAMHQALIDEHERGTHAWQLEWLALPQMFALTSSALRHALWLFENLQVDETRMQANVCASNGLMLAEALTMALSQTMERSEAAQLVGEASRTAASQNRHLLDVVQEKTSAPLDWDSLRNEANYLGSANEFIDRVLQEARDG
ncbi:MAG: 3-carboxy-cis,cis-muconate cycloisomerase [Omnitrophica WOR_2 bacterium]